MLAFPASAETTPNGPPAATQSGPATPETGPNGAPAASPSNPDTSATSPERGAGACDPADRPKWRARSLPVESRHLSDQSQRGAGSFPFEPCNRSDWLASRAEVRRAWRGAKWNI